MNNTAAFALVALAFAINAWPTQTEHVVIKPTVNTYKVAESFGCHEVARTCRARMHSTRIGDKHAR